ncbi:hypothetical protein TIFTF001_009052 [Ficus carica]|uniref:Uncharacterized protein n=1 Tax=Ficus carica TaxID=3494 RepID=A0AA88D291_FICCA|nr:hypothetical protein TIFTF001_009052 [Ficus carica]
MGSVISILWDKLCEACRWVVSKLEKFVNNLSEKINNLANRANRFSDNLTERLKESIAKAKRAMDENLEKIADSAALLEKKLSSDVEAIDNETVIQILKAVRSMVKQIQDLLKSMSNFVSLIDEVSRVTRNKGVKDGVEEIKNVMSDKDGERRIRYCCVKACALFVKDPDKNIKEMTKMESSDFNMLEDSQSHVLVTKRHLSSSKSCRAPANVDAAFLWGRNAVSAVARDSPGEDLVLDTLCLLADSVLEAEQESFGAGCGAISEWLTGLKWRRARGGCG